MRKYKELGMEQLYLPTTDHFEPTVEDLIVSATFEFLPPSRHTQH